MLDATMCKRMDLDLDLYSYPGDSGIKEKCGRKIKQFHHRKQLNEHRWDMYKNMSFLHTYSLHHICYFILLVILNIGTIHCETAGPRQFPKLFKAAQFRSIVTEPSQSTCGVQERSAFCKSSGFSLSVQVCDQDFCVQQCPGRTELPNHLNLLVQTMAFSDCVFLDTINRRPGSAFQSASTSFISTGPMCFVTPSVSPDFSSTQEFTITLWVWQRKDNNG